MPDFTDQTSKTFEYLFDRPMLNNRDCPTRQTPGTFIRLSGVDGRYIGRLRRFGGFRRYAGIPRVIDGREILSLHNTQGVGLFQGFAIQEDSQSSHLLRGFLFTGYGLFTNRNALFACYYSTRTSSWEAKTLYVPSGEFHVIAAAQDHRQFYVTGIAAFGNSFAKLIRYNGTGWVSTDFMPAAAPSYLSPPAAESSGKGMSSGGSVGVAFRIVYPEHGIYGQLSTITTVKLTSADQSIRADIPLSDALWAKSRYIELYRTIGSSYPFPVAARLYLERIYQVSTESGNITLYWAHKDYGGVSDDGLVLKDVLDPAETKVVTQFVDPINFVGVLDQTTFINVGTASDRTQGTDLEALRWSTVNMVRSNLFPYMNRRRPPDLSHRMKAMVSTDTFLAAVYDSSVLRIQKSGFRLAIDSLHNRFGTAGGAKSVISVGSNLYMVSNVGLLLCDLMTGQFSVAIETQHLFSDPNRWANDLKKVIMTYDSRLGVMTVYNPVKGESLLLWANEGVFTQLEDQEWVEVTTTTMPVEGGQLRSFFIEPVREHLSTIGVFVYDVEQTAQTRTIKGGPLVDDVTGKMIAWNGYAGAGSGGYTVLLGTDNSHIFHVSQTGCYIRFLTGLNKGEKRIISVVSSDGSNVLTGGDPWPYPIEAGDKFAVGAIPFRIVMWPITSSLFTVSKVTGGIVVLENISGDTSSDNPNMYMEYELYRSGDETVPAVTARGSLSSVPVKTASDGLDYANRVIIPGLAQYGSNVQFDLLGARFYGNTEQSVSTGS